MSRASLVCLVMIVGASAALAFAGAPARAGAPGAVSKGGITTAVSRGSARASSAAPSVSASSTTVFNNFGAGNGYNCCTGWTVSGPNAVGTFWNATEFQISTPYLSERVTRIDLALSHVAGPNTAMIQLAADGGGLPGAVLGTWFVSNLPSFGTCCTVVTVPVTANMPLLHPLTDYWLIARPISDDTWDAWNWNTTGNNGPVALNEGSGWSLDSPSDPRGAFDIVASP